MRSVTGAIKPRAAIVGCGVTEFSRDSGKTEQQMAVQAIMAAMEDSGIDVASIDGLVKYTADSTKESDLVNLLNLRGLRFYAEEGYGGMASAASIAIAHAAVASGQARCVVCYRSMNGRSGTRFGRGERMLRSDGPARAFAAGPRVFGNALTGPYGLLSPSQPMGMWAHRYAYMYGLSVDELAETLCEVAVGQRQYASNNPNAILRGKPLDRESYLASRMIASPLRSPDFCPEIDGAVAIVVTSIDFARDAARKPVEILAVNQNLKRDGDTPALYARDLERNGPEEGRQVFADAGIQPGDVDVATFYDATSIMVLMHLEDLGFCPRGKAPEFIRNGGLRLDGALPTNTQGGMLSEGYLHGINNAVEVVRQLRGEASNQVKTAEIGLFSVGYGSVLLRAP